MVQIRQRMSRGRLQVDKAVVLVSGGLDSATCLAMALEQGFAPVAVSFAYGQRHALELDAARRLVERYDVRRHYQVEIGSFRDMGGSSLTADVPVPKSTAVDEIKPGIPSTYVPARNTVFLAHALGIAEVEQAWDIFIGVNALDYSGYPDCRPEYIAAFETMANVATAAATNGQRRLRIHAPLINLTKEAIIRKAQTLKVPFEMTHSCYHPTHDGAACGQCDACLLRLDGFRRAGVADPVRYAPTHT